VVEFVEWVPDTGVWNIVLHGIIPVLVIATKPNGGMPKANEAISGISLSVGCAPYLCAPFLNQKGYVEAHNKPKNNLCVLCG
jgi:hypothetical protein